MQLSVGTYRSLHGIFAFKRLTRISTILLTGLTIFFAYPWFGTRSLFRQTTALLGISITSLSFQEIRTIIDVFSLAVGVLLVFLFLKQSSGEKAKGIAAVNFAWLGFVIEASTALSFQWLPYDVWIPHNAALFIFFTISIFFLAVSALLLTNYKWTIKLGYIASWFAFFVNMAIFIVLARFYAIFAGPFPTLSAFMAANCSLATFYLYRSYSPRTQRVGRIQFFYLRRFLSSGKVLGVVLLSILAVGAFASLQPVNSTASVGSPTKDVFVGVTYGGNTTVQAKELIDKVKGYTNLFVVDSWPIAQNETALNDICDYAVSSGLHVMVYFAWFNMYWQGFWLDSAKQRWGDMFLGVYLYDEPGGIQIDVPSKYHITFEPSDFQQAAKQYVQSFDTANRGRSDMEMLKMRGIKAFTSDYALYWFDYQAGYDGLFAEFGWNYSRQLNIALVRGAATVQNKDWGVIITWKYDTAPYIESGSDLYNDMVLAYNNGAKYILVFNYPYTSNSTYGALTQEHFDALAEFWNYKSNNPQPDVPSTDRVSYVLPSDYGYGFRGPNDTIWGVWQGDSPAYEPITNKITVDIYNALQQYGTRLDIVYDPLTPKSMSLYSELLYWNETISDVK